MDPVIEFSDQENRLLFAVILRLGVYSPPISMEEMTVDGGGRNLTACGSVRYNCNRDSVVRLLPLNLYNPSVSSPTKKLLKT